MEPSPPLLARALEENASFVRALARSLVGDDQAADDLAQDTWIIALERPPGHLGNVRAWLGTVVERQAGRRRLVNSRRVAREVATAKAEADAGGIEAVTWEDTLRRVSSAVLSLAEPERTTIFLRYYEGLSTTAIATRMGVPASTLRGRLQRALDHLRLILDQKSGGNREAWVRGLIPFIGGKFGSLGSGGGAATLVGGLIMGTTAKTMAGLLAAGLAALVCWWGMRASRPDAHPGATEPVSSGSAIPADVVSTPIPEDFASDREAIAGSNLLIETMDEAREPLSDVQILAVSLTDQRPIGLTGVDGQCSVTQTVGSFAALVAEKPGYVTAVQQWPERSTVSVIRLTLAAQAAAIEGRVVLPNHQPAAEGTLVFAWKQGTFPTLLASAAAKGASIPGSARTDDGGLFCIEGLDRHSSYSIAAAGPSFATLKPMAAQPGGLPLSLPVAYLYAARTRVVQAGGTDLRVAPVLFPFEGIGGYSPKLEDGVSVDWPENKIVLALLQLDGLPPPNGQNRDRLFMFSSSEEHKSIGPLRVSYWLPGYQHASASLQLFSIASPIQVRDIALEEEPGVEWCTVEVRLHGIPDLAVQAHTAEFSARTVFLQRFNEDGSPPSLGAQTMAGLRMLTVAIRNLGNHAIDGVPCGWYRVGTATDSGSPTEFERGGGWDVLLAAPSCGLDLDFSRLGYLEIAADDAHGEPLTDRLRTQLLRGKGIYRQDHFLSAPYRLALLDPGEYEVRAADDAESEGVSVMVAAGTQAKVVLRSR